MKITIEIEKVLDDLYADSALKALQSDKDNAPGPLGPDSREALKRFIIFAAADVAGLLARRLKGVSFPLGDSDEAPVVYEVSDDCAAHPEALAMHVASALSLGAMRFVATACGDNKRAEAYGSLLDGTVAMIGSCIDGRRERLKIERSYR